MVAKEVEAEVVDAVAVDAEASKPAAGELVARDDSDVFRAMDAMDEEQILDSLQGRPSEVMVYSFSAKGKKQTGLSWAGVAEVVRELNANRHTAIRVSPSVPPIVDEYQETNEDGNQITYFRVTVYAEDTLNGGGGYGMATQQKFQTYRDPERKPTLDHFALTKALSKAQRNAMEPLTPVKFREVLIAKMLGDDKRVRQVRWGQDAGKLAELPAPLEDDAAKALVDQARGLYEEIKALGGGQGRRKFTPGMFNAYLARAEHSHDRLRDFVAHLETRLVEIPGELKEEAA